LIAFHIPLPDLATDQGVPTPVATVAAHATLIPHGCGDNATHIRWEFPPLPGVVEVSTPLRSMESLAETIQGSLRPYRKPNPSGLAPPPSSPQDLVDQFNRLRVGREDVPEVRDHEILGPPQEAERLRVTLWLAPTAADQPVRPEPFEALCAFLYAADPRCDRVSSFLCTADRLDVLIDVKFINSANQCSGGGLLRQARGGR
jgi:hypothetical protein